MDPDHLAGLDLRGPRSAIHLAGLARPARDVAHHGQQPTGVATVSREAAYDAGPKPFNFLISPQVLPIGHPVGVDPEHFHLIAPYTRDARQWSKLRWTDIYSGESFTVTTRNQGRSERTACVQSYAGVIDRYQTHPELKSLGPDGLPCGRRTVGLLRRRPVVLGELMHIGKETNRMEEVEQGLVHDLSEVQLVFREPRDRSASSIGRDEAQSVEHRTCGSCGATLEGARKSYCSPACRQHAYRQRKRYATS